MKIASFNCAPQLSCHKFLIALILPKYSEHNRLNHLSYVLGAYEIVVKPVPGVIKYFSCSPQFSMKFFLLINVKTPTTVGILTFMNRKNAILGLSESEKC